jgi:diguanylate cyclase (GGDEF)-like protein
MLDLDGFKAINDIHGHDVGDEALVEFPARATSLIRAGTFMARVGGDEFAIVMTNTGSDEPARLAQRILAAVGKPLSVGGLGRRVLSARYGKISVGGAFLVGSGGRACPRRPAAAQRPVRDDDVETELAEHVRGRTGAGG